MRRFKPHLTFAGKAEATDKTMVKQSETADDTDEVFLCTIQNNTKEDEAFAELSIEGQMCIKFKIDTGAQVNVLPLRYYKKLPIKPGLIKGSHKLTSY
ncbi:hypothetical protein QYM36_008353 [Artemia franciscana]|uniref:Uncharacterized protein n=1 Tax=Artemia franciscana TaxID=6661 RepID=A0AA88LLE2_ARTSF|nr:hypothetical protein QYM36_008353 [Artemia franciscana]